MYMIIIVLLIKLFLARRTGGTRHRRPQQHEENRPGSSLLQSRTESRLADLHGAAKEVVDKKRVFVQQRSCAASRDDTSRADRTGNDSRATLEQESFAQLSSITRDSSSRNNYLFNLQSCY